MVMGIILAAGRGSRLGDLTKDKPKAMVRLCGLELLRWQIAALTVAGIQRYRIVTGYREEAIVGPSRVHLRNPRWRETNMVRSLLAVGRDLTDTVIVSYSDIVYAPACVRLLLGCDAPLAITYDPNWLRLWSARFEDPLVDAESFSVNLSGSLSDIGGHGRTIDDIVGQYMGLLRIGPDAWRRLWAVVDSLDPTEVDRLDTTGLLRILMRRGEAVLALPIGDPWGEVDAPDDIVLYESDCRFAPLRGMLEDLRPTAAAVPWPPSGEVGNE